MNTLDISLSEVKTVELYTDTYSEQYRHYDEHFVTTDDFKHYKDLFGDICDSFGRKINVLDIGCGSGRYFHTLRNVAHLTGIDVAPGMIKAAYHPVNEHELDIDEMDLKVGNIYTENYDNRKFDFIYCVGVLGGHAPLTEDICHRIKGMLTEDGIFYITVVDLEARKNTKRRFAEALYPLMPSPVKKILDKRWATNYLTLDQFETLMDKIGFSKCDISSFATTDKGWQGVQIQAICHA